MLSNDGEVSGFLANQHIPAAPPWIEEVAVPKASNTEGSGPWPTTDRAVCGEAPEQPSGPASTTASQPTTLPPPRRRLAEAFAPYAGVTVANASTYHRSAALGGQAAARGRLPGTRPCGSWTKFSTE